MKNLDDFDFKQYLDDDQQFVITKNSEEFTIEFLQASKPHSKLYLNEEVITTLINVLTQLKEN